MAGAEGTARICGEYLERLSQASVMFRFAVARPAAMELNEVMDLLWTSDTAGELHGAGSFAARGLICSARMQSAGGPLWKLGSRLGSSKAHS
jgi:hypothetical protein